MCLPLNTLKSLVSYTAMLTMGLGIFAILSGVIIDTNTKEVHIFEQSGYYIKDVLIVSLYVCGSLLMIFGIIGVFGGKYKNVALLSTFNIGEGISIIAFIILSVFGYMIVSEFSNQSLQSCENSSWSQQYNKVTIQAEINFCKTGGCKCDITNTDEWPQDYLSIYGITYFGVYRLQYFRILNITIFNNVLNLFLIGMMKLLLYLKLNQNSNAQDGVILVVCISLQRLIRVLHKQLEAVMFKQHYGCNIMALLLEVFVQPLHCYQYFQFLLHVVCVFIHQGINQKIQILGLNCIRDLQTMAQTNDNIQYNKLMDQQIQTSSTSSSSSSNSHKNPNDIAWNFDLSHHDKKKIKKPKKIVQRSYSYGLGSVIEEKEEKEELNVQRFRRLIMPSDHQEFQEKITRQSQPRKASLSPHAISGLSEVEEVRGDDEDKQDKGVFKFDLMMDMNEFNEKKHRSSYQYEKLSLESSIIEEDMLENVKERVEHQSPSYRLKVDEMDFNNGEKKQWTNPLIEIIEEEKPEFDCNEKAKGMFQQINRLLIQERDFLQKIVKGEVISDEDQIKKELIYSEFGEQHWNLLIQEAEENVISSNSDEETN